MIDLVFSFLKSGLVEFVTELGGEGESVVKFLAEDRQEAVVFPDQAITPVLVNLQEDRRSRPDAVGRLPGVHPSLPLNLEILFVSRHSEDYEQALKGLSIVLRYFQAHPIFTPDKPGGQMALPGGIEKLTVELLSPSREEMNDIWSSLRTHCLPAALYRVSMLVYDDRDAADSFGRIGREGVIVETEPKTPAEISKHHDRKPQLADLRRNQPNGST